MSSPNAKPVPKPTPETQPFWDGCADHELHLQHCQNCGHVQFYPRKLCSSCFSQDIEWRKASGRGTVRSWSEVTLPGAPGFQDEVPFTSALIALEEGPTMLSVLRNCTNDEVNFDMPVKVTFEEREGLNIPYFEPDR